MVHIPESARGRLLHILRILETVPEERKLTSTELETLAGWPSHTIRKDISCLYEFLETVKHSSEPRIPMDNEKYNSSSGAGYTAERLVPLIRKALGLDRRRKFCVVGLGRLGSAYLNLDPASLGEFELAAGFDSNVNRVEIIKSSAPLYPAYKMEDVIGRLSIEIALLCIPAEAAQGAAERLAAAGIRGIVNFAPVILTLSGGRPGGGTDNSPGRPGNRPVAVRNVHVADELRALAAGMG
ncbi:MAG: CoA-binding protein [Treponema sp.]|jgi:redox-sensing transcriptional repressor|nr:CoA-binding protein [Treponema sp.]